MDHDFFAYIERLELISFFSAYPLLFSFVYFIAGTIKKNNRIPERLRSVLPSAYALTGLAFLGLQCRNLYPDFSMENIRLSVQHPFLKAWALSTLLFFIPALAKKPALSLIHSLVFFFLVIKDLFFNSPVTSGNPSIIKNDMKLYTDSLLINAGAFMVVLLLFFLFRKFPPSGKKPLRF